MRLLFDDTSNRGSDAGFGVGKTVPQTDRTLFNDEDDSYQSLNAGQEIDPQTESYRSNNPAGGRPSDFEDSQYDSPNRENYSEEEFQEYLKKQRRGSLIDQAKKGLKQAKAKATRTAPKKAWQAFNDEDLYGDGSTMARDKAKEKVADKTRDYATDKIENLADEGIKKGFKKGIKSGTKKGAKVAADAATEGAEVAAEGAAVVGAEVAAEGAVVAAEGAVDVLGAATGFETFGLGFLLALLLNIAISLGVSDAVDAGFKLAEGDVKQAYFLAVRAAMKIGVFIYLLITLGFSVSIGGIFIAIPLLVILNIYMVLGLAFRKIPQFQGLVWWEIGILLIVDLFVFIISLAFLGALGWYLCNQVGGGSTVAGAIAAVYDWWNKTTLGTAAADFCKYVTTSTN